MHRRTSVLVALPLPRHGESAAADLAASHTGLGIPVLAIEGVRAHASAISTGAVAVFRAFQRAQPGVDRSRRPPVMSLRSAPDQSAPCHVAEVYVHCNSAPWMIFWRRLAQRLSKASAPPPARAMKARVRIRMRNSHFFFPPCPQH